MLYAALMVGGFLAGLISGAAGFGGGMLLLPVATACVGAQRAVPMMTVAQLMGNASRMTMGWKEIQWRSVGLFSLTALPLAALGAFGFSVLPKAMVTRCIGLALVLLVAVKLWGKKELPRTDATLLVGGAVTGGVSGLCGSGGPIGAAVFLSRDLSPVAYIASEAATAVAMHLLKTVIYSKLTGVTADTLLLGAAVGTCMVAGTYAANRWLKRVEKNRFQTYTTVLLCAMGVYMLATGLS